MLGIGRIDENRRIVFGGFRVDVFHTHTHTPDRANSLVFLFGAAKVLKGSAVVRAPKQFITHFRSNGPIVIFFLFFKCNRG